MDRITLQDGTSLDVSQYPLPEDIDPDLTCNRGDLAKVFGKTPATISEWVSRGMPVETEGHNGVAYEFRVSHCWAWRCHDQQMSQARAAEKNAQIGQAALAFRNLEEDNASGEVMTARQIAEEAEADYKRQRAAEQRGDLLRRHLVEELFERILVAYRNKNTAAVDFAEIEFGLSAEEVEKLQGFMDQVIVQARIELEGLVRPRGDVSALHPGEQDEMGL